MKRMMMLFGLIFCSNIVFAQYELEWSQFYGGTNREYSSAIIQLDDASYVVAGTANSSDGDVGGNNGGSDFWLIKTDVNGSLLWDRNYGGSSSDECGSMIQTSDGGFILVGSSFSNDGDVGGNYGGNDFWVVKIDANGNIEWQQNYGGSLNEHANSVKETSDGGYIVAGYSSSNDGDIGANYGGEDFWVIKIDSGGALLWEQNYGGNDRDNANDVIETSDGGFLLVGFSTTSWVYNFSIIKTDASGNVQWQKIYGGLILM